MPAGDEQRLAAQLAAQYPAELLAAVQQRRVRAGLRVGLDEAAYQLRFGHADARQVGHHAKVCGNAQPARMADAMAIDEHQVRCARQQRQRSQQRRQFAEAEQARDIGHHGGDAGDFLRHRLQGVRVEQHGRSAGDRAVFLEADIQPGQPAHGSGQPVLPLHAGRQLLLLFAGGADAAFPAPGVDQCIHRPQDDIHTATAR